MVASDLLSGEISYCWAAMPGIHTETEELEVV